MARVRLYRLIAGLLVVIWLALMFSYSGKSTDAIHAANTTGNLIPRIPQTSLGSSITRSSTHSTQQRPQIHIAGKGPDFGPDRALFATSPATTSIVSLKATDIARVDVNGTALLFQCDQTGNEINDVRLLLGLA